MFNIIIRSHGTTIVNATADNPHSAHTLFHALTKTFLVVELWQGTTLVSSYNNT
jgi:hypothetical protein